MIKKALFLKKFVIMLGLIAIVGILAYKAALSIPVQRAVLLIWPRPVPRELVGVKPGPGSHVTADDFNYISNGSIVYGKVSIQSYGYLLGLEELDFSSAQLLINGTSTQQYWLEERDWFGMGQTRDLDKKQFTATWWDMYLGAGDYLAELTIRGKDRTLVYAWAFRITNE
jgi:hypothetical protein